MYYTALEILTRTVGKLQNLTIQPVSTDNMESFLSWIHPNAAPAELAAILQEYNLRLGLGWMPQPLEAISQCQRIAGVYFTCIPGQLAMLGGLRSSDSSSTLVGQLLVSSVQMIRSAHPQWHLQAALDPADSFAQQLCLAAGFHPLTEVDQLWRSIDDHSLLNSASPIQSKLRVQLQPASVLSRCRFEQLLGQTFEGTLDCPELNGVRSHHQVLQSFLMGRSFRDSTWWYSLWLNNRPVGCLLLTSHHSDLVELSYMGLIASARRMGLGHYLVQQAIRAAASMQSSILFVAADTRNLPAQQLYMRNGFRFHRRLKVFWYR